MLSESLSIHGVVPPVPTPFTAGGRIDEPAIRRIVDHLVEGGCDAAFFLGSTGELASLSTNDREIVIRAAVEASGGRIPILAGVADTCRSATVDLAHRASDLGVDALVLAAPYYFDLAADELKAYFCSILPEFDRPTLLYNMPWLTGLLLDKECLIAALDFPHVIGFKDSSGNLEYLRGMLDVARRRSGTTVLVGDESLYLDALKLGAHGVVGGGGNVFPHLFRGLQDAFDQGNPAAAEEFQRAISTLGKQLGGLSDRPSAGFCAVKAGLAALGLCEAHMAPPLIGFDAAQQQRVREILASPLADFRSRPALV